MRVIVKITSIFNLFIGSGIIFMATIGAKFSYLSIPSSGELMLVGILGLVIGLTGWKLSEDC